MIESDDQQVKRIQEQLRTEAQNRFQWPILNAWAKQKEWPINGVMTRISADDYKDILTAAFEGETMPRVAMGYSGGIVMLGRRTSKYGKKRFSEWADWLVAASVVSGIKIPAAKWMEDEQRRNNRRLKAVRVD